LPEKILACDLDGVVFQFNKSYCDLFWELFGIKFPAETSEYPDVWNYEAQLASQGQIEDVWHEINGVRNFHFWRHLPPYEGAQEFLKQAQEKFDDIYFITSRSGPECQRATEGSLEALGVKDPKVIISNYKVPDLIHIGATDFLDDRDKNFEDCIAAGLNEDNANNPLNLWMLDKPWNRHYNHPWVERISSPGAIFA
jgi:5'(3')-deoxyribonucleotidase